MNFCYWLNTAWMRRCRREARAFERATVRVAETQAEVLRRIVRKNQATEYGRRHGFERIKTPTDFQQRIPLSSYGAYADSIDRLANGAQNVLTREPVQLFEPTSGTTRGEKLIPYTASLRRQFQRMAAAWIYDLMRSRPAVRRGRAYWSISPAMSGKRRTPAGVPIGFDDDAQYLGGVERFLARHVLAVPASVAKLSGVDQFRYATLLHLLRARDLTLVSVWSPTFLESLFLQLEAWTDRLIFDVGGADAELLAILRSRLAFADKASRIWPQLALISCWADASAAMYVERVRAMFPHAEIQPKGLIATEGCVSFPLFGSEGGALALRSHFFEFLEQEPADAAACRRADELELAGRYRVVLTTGGGLYRYDLGDVVEVVGFRGRCPLLRFLGRAGPSCDLVGEKLEEAFVRRVLEQAFCEYGSQPRFVLLAPAEDRPLRYRLYLQPSGPPPRLGWQAFLDTVQAGLEENPHYRYAVDLGQLSVLELSLLDSHGPSAWSAYERRRLAAGQRPGDIKPAALDAWPGWRSEFAPWIERACPPLAAQRIRAD